MTADSTCWTMLSLARAGDVRAREAFALRYLPLVRAYLGARWTSPMLRERLDDAVQDAFLECLRGGGALERLDPSRPGGFRAYLLGVLRNVARRAEERLTKARGRSALGVDLDDLPAEDESLAQALDRAWAQAMLREAAERQRASAALAEERGQKGALARVELLRLRFQEGLPIRDIAVRWGVAPEGLHREYAKARHEFRTALEATLADHQGGSDEERGAALERLLAAAT